MSKRERLATSNSSPYGHVVGIVALVCIFIGAPLVGTGHGLELILLAAVAMLGFIFWRPLQAWAARLESQAAPVDTAALAQRLQHLESLIDAMAKQQIQLQETVHWQAQLLQRTSDEPARRPTAPTSVA